MKWGDLEPSKGDHSRESQFLAYHHAEDLMSNLCTHPSDVGYTPRSRTYSGTSNGSSSSNYYNNQHYNTIGHNRHRTTTGPKQTDVEAGGLLRSSSATDVNCLRTPKPRATLLTAARIAKGSTNSLRKMWLT